MTALDGIEGPLRRASSSAPAPPARRRRCSSPARGCASSPWTAARYGTDTLSTHALMRGRRAAARALGPARADRGRRHAARAPDGLPLRGRGRRRSRSSRRTASPRSTRRAAPCSTASSWTRPSRPGPRSVTTCGSPTSSRGGREGEGRRRPRRTRRDGAGVRAGIVIGADGLRSTVASLVGAPVTRQGRHAITGTNGASADNFENSGRAVTA